MSQTSTLTSTGVITNGTHAITWSNSQLARIEDLELALDAAVHVNRHLNKEIEGLLQQIEREKQQRQAWEQQAKRLAQQLSQYKRAAGVFLLLSCASCVLCLSKSSYSISKRVRHLAAPAVVEGYTHNPIAVDISCRVLVQDFNCACCVLPSC